MRDGDGQAGDNGFPDRHEMTNPMKIMQDHHEVA